MQRSKHTLHLLTTMLALCILGWFLYHTVQGEHGWLSMIRLRGEVAKAQATLSQLQKEHQELGHRVEMMRPGSMDPDLLDEKSREMLDYSKPNEVIILTKPEAPATAPEPNNLLQRSKNSLPDKPSE